MNIFKKIKLFLLLIDVYKKIKQVFNALTFGASLKKGKWWNKDTNKTDKARDALKYFLKNLFRKENFLPGQLEILNKSIQQKNTLGILPTGGGKSIAYQLAALLQPGFSVIVSPLMSVLTDQIRALKNSGIDGVRFINASVKKTDEINNKLAGIENAESLFIFTEPEYIRNKK